MAIKQILALLAFLPSICLGQLPLGDYGGHFGGSPLISSTSAVCPTACPGNFTSSAIDTRCSGTGCQAAIVIATSFYTAAPTFTDNCGAGCSNTWNHVTDYGLHSGVTFYYCFPCSTGATHTFTSTGGSTAFGSFAVAAFNGVMSATLDGQSGNSGAGATIQTGDPATTHDGDILVTAIGDAAPMANTVNSGFTVIQSQNYSNGNHYAINLAWQKQTTHGAINPTWSSTANPNVAAAIIALPTAAIPSLSLLSKTHTPTNFTKAGDQITYHYSVKNTSSAGLPPITNISIKDTVPGGTIVTISNCIGSLASGATDSTSCSNIYTTTNADALAGTATNTANAFSGSITSNSLSDTVNCTGCAPPSMTLSKAPSTTTYSNVGDSIVYTFTIQNTGGVDLTNILITDPTVSNPTGCPTTLLKNAPAATCQTMYSVNSNDLANNQIVNQATATASYTTGGISVSVSPTTSSLTASQTQQFTATVSGTTNQAVTWAISPNTGTITTGGFYTAPSTITTTQMVTVTATSVADNTKSASATVTLNPVGSGVWSFVGYGYDWCFPQGTPGTNDFCDPGVTSQGTSHTHPWCAANLNTCTFQTIPSGTFNVAAGDLLIFWLFDNEGRNITITSVCPATFPGGVCTGPNLPLVKCTNTPGTNPGCTGLLNNGFINVDAGYVLSAPAGLGNSFKCTMTGNGVTTGYGYNACEMLEFHWSGSSITYVTSAVSNPNPTYGASGNLNCGMPLGGFTIGCLGLAFPGLANVGPNYLIYQNSQSGCSNTVGAPNIVSAPYVSSIINEGWLLSGTNTQAAVAPYWNMNVTAMPPNCSYANTDVIPMLGIVFQGH